MRIYCHYCNIIIQIDLTDIKDIKDINNKVCCTICKKYIGDYVFCINKQIKKEKREEFNKIKEKEDFLCDKKLFIYSILPQKDKSCIYCGPSKTGFNICVCCKLYFQTKNDKDIRCQCCYVQYTLNKIIKK